MIGLTKVQMRLLRYIVFYQSRHKGRSPSLYDMSVALGLAAKSQAFHTLNRLEERRYIRREAHTARAIEVLHRPKAVLLPVRILSAKHAHWNAQVAA